VLEPGVHVKISGRVIQNLDFGLGVAIVNSYEQGIHSQVGSYFWGGLYGTWFWIDPANEVVVVGLMNKLDFATKGPFAREVCAKWVYKALNE
jgi:CubicO group peptidase (beta-lactamase class C family)